MRRHGELVSGICAPCCKQFCSAENCISTMWAIPFKSFFHAQVLLGFALEVYGLYIILRVSRLGVFVHHNMY